MTLSQVSLTAKPNFLIIDEGWSCLDSDNLSNVGAILSRIKSHYDHLIIISHLEELKNEADYVVTINKINGYSCLVSNNRSKRSKRSKHSKRSKGKKHDNAIDL